MRDKQKEELNRTKPNWEHLNEDLHVLITCEDTENRAQLKLIRAREEVKKLLVPTPDGEDDLKRRQLVELALMNGTYRDTSTSAQSAITPAPIVAAVPISQNQRMLATSPLGLPTVIASPSVPTGTQLFLAPRFQSQYTAVTSLPSAMLGQAAGHMIQATDPTGTLSTGAPGVLYPYCQYLSSMFEYSATNLDRSAAGAIRRTVAYRDHPYTR